MTAPPQLPSHIRSGFISERRNLFIVSIALLAFQATGATISKLEIFGNPIDLKSPLSITVPLWLAWGYFFLRFYQYFRDLGDKGFISRAMTRAVVAAVPRARARYVRENSVRPKADFPNPSTPEVDFAAVEWRGSVTGTGGGWRYYVEGDVRVWGELRVLSASEHFKDIVVLPPRTVIVCQAIGWGFVLLHTTLVTEYVLPFLVGAAPLVAILIHVVK